MQENIGEPCPICGSTGYEYLVFYRIDRATVVYCSDCWENGYLIREWR